MERATQRRGVEPGGEVLGRAGSKLMGPCTKDSFRSVVCVLFVRQEALALFAFIINVPVFRCPAY